MKKVFISLVIVVAILVGVIVVYNIGDSSGSLETSTNSIVGSLENIGELATAEYMYTLTQTAEKPNKEIAGFKIPLTSSKIIFSYSGLVKAGFDFSDIIIDANATNKTINVKFPEVKLLSNDLDADSLVVYDESNSPFNSFSMSDINASQEGLKEKAIDAAKENGLYDKAVENAKTIISAMLWNIYDKNEYSINFE